MDQITALFENINWDNVLGVVADYVTQINIGDFLQAIIDFFMGFLGEVAGGLLGGIL